MEQLSRMKLWTENVMNKQTFWFQIKTKEHFQYCDTYREPSVSRNDISLHPYISVIAV